MDDNTFDAKRRNLLAITVVLCFLKFADASVSSTATVSALSITVKRPEAIFDFLWLLWAYFFLRAYQHFHYHLKLPYKKSIQKTLVPILHPYAARSGVPDEFERELHEELERFYKYDLRFNLKPFLKGLWWAIRHPFTALIPMLAPPVQISRRRHINFVRYPVHTTGLRRLTAQSVYA
ncbi:hypothetical protein [uncultured Piscinibacter sp.]|uniref:hypothetical protein n=1 Tax=uncultured Piscinibacter sp. TaxID=1131835 RepID=UPI0026036C01|nr:hypothetical protein [uncultured Piscinibacter sp.]